MSKKLFQLLAATTALTAAFPALAQSAADGATSEGDIIVTARREAENIQNVPVAVQVVTGSALLEKSITTLQEVSKLAPGLNITTDTGQIVLRGVAWRPGSGTPATPIYLNEAPFDPGTTIASIFDIGQIEVLRGPQGTRRGAPSISGAITITTRKPDLDEIGGYVQASYGEGKHSAFQGGLGVPLIKNVLAVRVAANIEDSERPRGAGITSVNSTVKPHFRDRTVRFSALFKPTDTLTFEAMYQRRSGFDRFYTQVVGTGSPGLASAGIPANFNGPALTLSDQKSVQDAPSYAPVESELITAHASWDILGQQLNYNYGRQFGGTPITFNNQDTANFLPGYEPFQTVQGAGNAKFNVHEIRLSSIRAPGRFFDYDIGFFSKHSSGKLFVNPPGVFLSGAFGAPGTPPGAVRTPDSRYVLPVSTDISLGQSFDSFYGNVEFHIGENTELSAGLRHIKDRVPVSLNVTTGAARTVAVPLAALGGLPCPGIPGIVVTGLVNSVYPGFCDALVPAGAGNQGETHDNTYKKTIYNVSLSHRFSDDLMVYATSGSSYRSGLPAIANNGLPAGFLVPGPETARSYELGVKASLGRRLRVNAAIFQIDYKGQLTAFEGIQYWNSISSNVGLTSLAFYRNVDARSRGFELEINAKPTDNLSLGANFSYSKITSQGGTVPCNDPARPITAANRINQCPSTSGQQLNQSPPFQATFDGSYTVPLGSMEGYFRFNLNINGSNPNYGNVVPTQSYAILDLFAGVTGNKAGWDLGVYAKNVLDKQVELGRAALQNNIYGAYSGAAVGYYSARISPPREIGVTLRYAFGSR